MVFTQYTKQSRAYKLVGLVSKMKVHSLAVTLATAASFFYAATASETKQQIGQSCASANQVCAENLWCDPAVKICLMPVAEEYNREVLRKRQTSGFTPVIGAGAINGGTGNTNPQNRYPIGTMQSSFPDQFNMYLWALYIMQRVSESNSLSYYQLAGIHGRPFIPWQEPSSPSQDTSTGYCTHNSALFGTWHRPYLALIEQRVVAHAMNEASKFQTGTVRTRMQTAARNLRIPYWDWASADTQSSIPAIIRTQTVTVTRPDSNGVPIQSTIPNPLYQYRFTNANFRTQYFGNPLRSDGITLRYPNSARTASQNNLADQAMRSTYSARRQNTYNLFSIPTFREFSNTQFSSGGEPNRWNSVESIHNEIHSFIGGGGNGGGWMTYVDYSSFDPIFFIHHTSVDRLVAMYQAIYPGRVVTPQRASGTFARRVTSSSQVDDINTPLAPFRKPSGSYYTSRDVSSARSIYSFGYAYPEVPPSYRTRTDSELSAFTSGRVNALYRPSTASRRRRVKRAEEPSLESETLSSNSTSTSAATSTSTDSTKKLEWIAHILMDASEFKTTTQVLLFLGDISPDPKTRLTQDNLIGGGASFAKLHSEMTKKTPVTATVPLTEALKKAGLDTDDRVSCVEYLKSKLRWAVQSGNEDYPLSELSSLSVGASSAVVDYSTPIPTWGNFETFYQVTSAKAGGLTVAESTLVSSKTITNVSKQTNHDTVSKLLEGAVDSVSDAINTVTNGDKDEDEDESVQEPTSDSDSSPSTTSSDDDDDEDRKPSRNRGRFGRMLTSLTGRGRGARGRGRPSRI